jgi:hypothetical protein
MRSKEEWFYRLQNSIKLHSKTFLFSTNLNHKNLPIDQIELEYNPQKYSLNIDTNNSSSVPTDNYSSFKINDFPYPTWRMLIKTFFERIYFFPSIHNNPNHAENLNNDYLCLINNLISRCTINFNVKNYFKEKIHRELKHFKLPYYIHWIRLTHFHFDNIYPKIENFQKISFNHNGLWTAVDFTYQGNISIEFTIKINLIREKEYSFLPTSFKRLFYLRENIQVLRKIINTILIITVGDLPSI